MSDSSTLTFAELELVLALRPAFGTVLRGNLGLQGDAQSRPHLVRAGLASLLVRGLCETTGPADGAESGTFPDLRFGAEPAALLRALADAGCATVMAAAWGWERGSVLHLVDGGDVRIALYPERFGRFKVETLDTKAPVSELLRRFLFEHLTEGKPSALVATSARGDRSATSLAIAVDTTGQWSVSDSFDNPDHAVPTTEQAAVARLAELFDGADRAADDAAHPASPDAKSEAR